jgi:hypothetical protein
MQSGNVIVTGFLIELTLYRPDSYFHNRCTSFGEKLDVRGSPAASIPVRRVQHGVVRVLSD